jgi:hypothetical protein
MSPVCQAACPDSTRFIRRLAKASGRRGSTISGVEVLDDAHSWTGIGVGFKVGMRVPGVVTVATVHGHGEKVFVAVHGDTPRGVRVRLAGARWDEWIVGCADPEAVAATLAPAS